jgi:hypothetical protein
MEKSITIKNVEVPRLESYSESPNNRFWEKFPKRKLPQKPATRINVKNLEISVRKVKDKLTKSELKRAHKVIKDLKKGAEAYQKSELPALIVQNDKSAVINGQIMTDTIATWVNKGFVAGPFDTPPMPGFRTNPLKAVVRNGKVRPVLNMSSPIGSSFNDNVKQNSLERVHMSTPKEFGYALRDAGRGAVFSKYDICDALMGLWISLQPRGVTDPPHPTESRS